MPPQDTAAGSATGYPFPDSGMTLRDYFAAKAMALSHAEWMRYRDVDPDANRNAQIDYEIVAEDAYELADAMLKARGQ